MPRAGGGSRARGLGRDTDETALGLVAALAILAALPATRVRGTADPVHRPHRRRQSATAWRPRAAAASSSSRRACPSEFGPGAFVDYWTTSEPTGQPDLFADFEQPPDVTWDGSVLAGSIPLLDSNGDPGGVGHVLARPSRRRAIRSRSTTHFRDGNQQFRVSGVTPADGPERHPHVGGSTFSLETCFADETTTTVFQTNPNAIVLHFSDRGRRLRPDERRRRHGLPVRDPQRGRRLLRRLRHVRRRRRPRSRGSAKAR